MSNINTKLGESAIHKACATIQTFTGVIPVLVMAFIGLIAPSVKAQTTVTIANPIPVIFGGAGVIGVYPGYTNSQVAFTLTAPADPIDLRVNVVGNPAGVTAGLVPSALNPNTAANISTLLTTTISTNVFLSVAVNNAPKGSYPLELIASNTVSSVLVTNSSTVLVLPNVFITANSANTNWSTDANWSLGAKPVAGDSVRFQYTNNVATNSYFDTSIVLDSLELMPKVSGLSVTNYFAPGVTVAVNGSNGFWAGPDVYSLGTPNITFNFALTGIGGALVVTNPTAPFSMYSMIYNNVAGSVQDMSGLGNLYADVRRFGVGDNYLIYPTFSGNKPSEMGVYSLARTNIIRATYVGNYDGITLMTNSIGFFNCAVNTSAAANQFINLGITNIFYADSMSMFSLGASSGVDTDVIRFNPAFTNGNAAAAVFRGTNGGAMSYFGQSVDSGSASPSRTRGIVNFTGGTLDMAVDTFELARNCTNKNGNYNKADFIYPMGKVDARLVHLGYQAPNGGFTPASLTGVRVTLTLGGIGSNAVMNVSDTMQMCEGLFTETAANSSFVRVNINSGGKINVNKITWGTNVNTGLPNPAAGSVVTIASGGQLTVTNTICSSTAPMPSLTIASNAQLAFHVTAGVTNAFVTTLTDSAGSKLNIASLNGFSPTVPATNVLIHYENASGAGAHQIAIGTIPAGYNNIIIVDTGLPDKNIEMRLATNAPATLIWKGYVDNVWDHSTPNWYNPANNSQVAFFDADTVVFAETNSPSYKTISVTEGVIPTGIYMSNSASAYAFEGAGSISACPMTKQGTANFTNNVISGAVVQFNGGTLLGTGTLGGVTMSTNTVLSYGGSVTASLVVNGGAVATLLSGGSANGPVSVSGNGVFTNLGTIQGGSLAVNGTALLVNEAGGWLRSIGSSGSGNVAAGAMLINIGTIGDNGDISAAQANTLTINGTFKDMGVGSIYLTTCTFNGGSTFLPGGNGVGVTEIKSASVGSSFPGRLTMLQNSTNIIYVDFANPQTNTIIRAQFTDFGGNTAVKSFDGCTVLMSNINTGAGVFAVGQSFRVFTGPSGSDIGNEGLNTTNRYPILSPFTPAANTKWDLANLRDTTPNGIINIVSFPTTGTNITSSSFRDGSNIVTHLQWPAEYIGWRLQQQTNALTVGLSTNWTSVSGSSTNNELYITNDASIDTSFFRMVYP